MNNKPIPYITIEGTVFEVDIHNQQLVERADPRNTISFIDQMISHGSHYDLAYDKITRKAFDRSNDFDESDDYTVVKIPLLIELDPQGMSEKYGVAVSDLKYKTDFDVIVNGEVLNWRLQGHLPQVDIAGDQYILDMRLEELRDPLYAHQKLSLTSFELSPDGESYTAFYHPVSKKLVDLDPKLTEFPEGVIMVKLPGEISLDPIAAARKYGIDEYDLLRKYPPQKTIRAEVIPLSETGIPAMIARNREQLQMEHRENAKRIRPKRKPGF